MRYQDFINELCELVAAGEQLYSVITTHNDAGFRAWRHRAESLVQEAKDLGYRLPGNCKSDTRAYRAIFYGASIQTNITALKKELDDSLIELRFLIDNYKKYGEPIHTQLADSAHATERPDVPDKVTPPWLTKNVP